MTTSSADKNTATPKVLKRRSLPDTFTRALYSVSPYRGCAHGCRYCDGRAEKYYVEGDFERDITIRENIPDLLETELIKIRERGIICIGSGVTDAYQPLEKKHRITERCLLAIERRGLPVLIMTKSALVLRDIDIWQRIAAGPGAILVMSITSLDDSIRATMEPGSSSFSERIETLAEFKRIGCVTGALVMPLLPGISDDAISIGTVAARLRDINVDYAMPGGLTLRPGRQKDCFFTTLRNFHPELETFYCDLYAEERPSGTPLRSYTTALIKRTSSIWHDLGLNWTLPQQSYHRFVPVHDELRILLRDMIDLYGARSINTRPLLLAADRYDQWLTGIRTYFRRHRSLPTAWLETRFFESLQTGELAHVLNNEKLSRFIDQIAHNAFLDYKTLQLQPLNSCFT